MTDIADSAKFEMMYDRQRRCVAGKKDADQDGHSGYAQFQLELLRVLFGVTRIISVSSLFNFSLLSVSSPSNLICMSEWSE